MIQYWSFWNYAGFLAYKNDVIVLSPPLKASIIFTSLVGGYITYVYPRKLTISLGNIKYRAPYYQMVIGDLIFHQYPIISTLLIGDMGVDDKCALTVLFPFTLWYSGVTGLNLNKDKLYGIKMNYLLIACGSIVSTYGLIYHGNKLLKRT